MANPLRLLIVTDSEDSALLIVRQLGQEGYEPRWERVDSRNGFAEMLDKRPWDVVISEYATPGFGGLEALETARQMDRDLPVIIVAGQIGEESAAETIKAGAGDFLLRSHLERLPAAVKRALSGQKTAQSALGKSERTLQAADGKRKRRHLVLRPRPGLPVCQPVGRETSRMDT